MIIYNIYIYMYIYISSLVAHQIQNLKLRICCISGVCMWGLDSLVDICPACLKQCTVAALALSTLRKHQFVNQQNE